MWYTKKVRPDVKNAARELAIKMNHIGLEHRKVLVCLIGYLKFKNTKGIIIINPIVFKYVMCGNSN